MLKIFFNLKMLFIIQKENFKFHIIISLHFFLYDFVAFMFCLRKTFPHSKLFSRYSFTFSWNVLLQVEFPSMQNMKQSLAFLMFLRE